MCGIAGWIDWSRTPSSADVLRRMNDAIAHRGPDGDGIFFAQTSDGAAQIGLAHRRLAIIDLNTGAQPMHSGDGAVTIVFNGEIYNFRELREELIARQHRFQTASDTEVIIEAYREWGPQSVSRLRGMFAFALWDAERELLVLARDPFGKKPLYLCRQPGRLLFGSEIKALLAHPEVAPRLDRQSVLDYLQYRYVPGPNTLFDSIVKLDPGTYAVWQDGQLTTTCYYRPPDGDGAPEPQAETDPVAAFRATLDEAVRLRMVADVPFGAFLSGGIDSSAVVALMSRHSELPINTFSVGFNEAKYSELDYARQVATQFKTNHHELIVAPEDVIDRLPEAIGYRDAPVAETADVPIWMLSQEAGKSVKMVLTGEGSDEVLAGYPKHKYEPYVAMYQRLVPALLHDRLIEPLIDMLPYGFYRARTLAHSFGLRDPMERLPRWFGALDLAERDELVALDVPPRPVATRPFTGCKQPSPLRRMLYFDQTSWLSDNLLERGDRMTMAASIEARMPFMDTKLAEFISRHQDSCRIRRGESKWLLRRAMEPILPPDILHRAKVGFRVPVNLWFRTVLKDYIRDLLLGPESLTRDYYRRDALAQVLDQHADGRTNHEKLIWSLMNLELFQRRYRLSW
jgi:asparagine synthase (glutamine-hydrolysing)